MPIWFVTLQLRGSSCAASLRYRNRAEITVLTCSVNRSLIRYGFPTSTKAIHGKYEV